MPKKNTAPEKLTVKSLVEFARKQAGKNFKLVPENTPSQLSALLEDDTSSKGKTAVWYKDQVVKVSTQSKFDLKYHGYSTDLTESRGNYTCIHLYPLDWKVLFLEVWVHALDCWAPLRAYLVRNKLKDFSIKEMGVAAETAEMGMFCLQIKRSVPCILTTDSQKERYKKAYDEREIAYHTAMMRYSTKNMEVEYKAIALANKNIAAFRKQYTKHHLTLVKLMEGQPSGNN